MTQSRLLIVEDDQALREALVDTLMLAGYHCVEAGEAAEALQILSRQRIDMVITDVNMPGMNGMELLDEIKQLPQSIPVIIMTAFAKVDDAVNAMRQGVIDYMTKPFSPEVLVNVIGQHVPAQKVESQEPVAEDNASKQLLILAKKVAVSDASVMVLGPSGSGKEVLARYIHDHSNRATGPFIAINCAAIPENMLEATLFGYEKGAFTGAVNACPGKFEQAQGGTILLDEITEMDLNLQTKLLRVLQEKEVERLGGRKAIQLDVRIIATSNRVLKDAVADGLFREDLYYRLNVFPLTWKPLGERPADIVPLAERLLAKHSQQQGRIAPELSEDAKRRLTQYQWPGNVRELENVIQRALILTSQPMIHATDILIEHEEAMIASQSHDQTGNPFKNELKEQESRMILQALEQYGGSRKTVAEKLGISPRTLRYKIAKMRDAGVKVPA
ncbi:sigma-54-dependent transcriptional regulator [Algicola sagamiensis]|uniref:sigma-54-dependent transcriptional regulator n=1 Tax=Algicola sagamiensis TaxID=163869 RepID=UPI000382AC45|nr:sigma 54-interacting transcriptional regulator [Algicola sagamiensis]